MKEKIIAMVDDEPEICETVSEYLCNKGFRVECFGDAESFLKYLNKEKPDLIILDLMLPGMHGFEACRKLKSQKRFASIPIIIVSANSEDNDKVSGLDLGADDYMVKPISLKELNARIKVILKRHKKKEEDQKINVGNILFVDLLRYKVLVDGIEIDLTPTEFKILEHLCSKKGQVLTRDMILGYLWGEEKVVVARTIDVHIKHLREKLGKAGDYIQNVRGIGYKLDEIE